MPTYIDGLVEFCKEQPFSTKKIVNYIHANKMTSEEVTRAALKICEYISMEWKVYLWSKGLTTNYFSTEFSEDELKCLLAYLKYVTGEYSTDIPIIKEMLNLGVLYG